MQDRIIKLIIYFEGLAFRHSTTVMEHIVKCTINIYCKPLHWEHSRLPGSFVTFYCLNYESRAESWNEKSQTQYKLFHMDMVITTDIQLDS